MPKTLFCALLLFACGVADSQRAFAETRRLEYRGWTDGVVLSNGKVETIVVPSVGRVMQFRFRNEPDGPFWENPAMAGKAPDPLAKEWGNFGGDKTWPSPQGEWERIAKRGWPPPATFDAKPLEARIENGAVWLRSAVDPHYGIRTERRIELVAGEPTMSIVTTYRKTEGPPVRAGVWIITQLKHPVAVFAPVPEHSIFPTGHNKQSDNLPEGLVLANGLLSLRRDAKRSSKIGTDAEALLWAGEKELVEIRSPRVPGAEYPDQGSSAEVYTNPDPNAYVELELLGPLRDLKVGDSVSQTNTYTLHRREGALLEQAKKILQP